jgi:hypothetical protein
MGVSLLVSSIGKRSLDLQGKSGCGCSPLLGFVDYGLDEGYLGAGSRIDVRIDEHEPARPGG